MLASPAWRSDASSSDRRVEARLSDSTSQSTRATAASVRDPELLGEQREERRLERRLRVPRELAFLDGHYPGKPLVAGVVQLRWVLDAARALLGAPPAVVGFEGLRFRDVLVPEQELRLWLELSEPRDLLRFQLDAEGCVFAAGRVRLASSRGA